MRKPTKYTLLIALLVILVCIYIFKFGPLSGTNSRTNIANKTKAKTKVPHKSAEKKGGNGGGFFGRVKNAVAGKSESEGETENIRGDAEELYDIAHENMAQGVKRDEFAEMVGDLADDGDYIKLKQLYNEAKEAGKNPLKEITVEDYVRVLSEDNE